MRLIIIFTVFMVIGCGAAEPDPPLKHLGRAIAAAEFCGIDTHRFYQLATVDEVTAVMDATGRVTSLSCSTMAWGNREESQDRYDRILRMMEQRVNGR